MSIRAENGKGSAIRQSTNFQKFGEGWERTFGKEKNKPVTPPKTPVNASESSGSVDIPETPQKAKRQEWGKARTVFKKYGL